MFYEHEYTKSRIALIPYSIFEHEEEPAVSDEVDTSEVPQVGDETVDTVNYGRGMRYSLAPASVNLTNLTEEDVWMLT